MDKIVSEILDLMAPDSLVDANNKKIISIIIDSRQITLLSKTLFVALKGKYTDGHNFIEQLYRAGVRYFLISDTINQKLYPLAIFWKTNSPLEVLQHLALAYRKKMPATFVGITGSVGKTILKEWLFDSLSGGDREVFHSPRSYNSQLGLPLSVLAVQSYHNIALLEAGISEKEEMQRLADISSPDIGVMTHIDATHDEGFSSREEKISEKIQLFKHCKKIVCASNNEAFDVLKKTYSDQIFYWSFNDATANLNVIKIKRDIHSSTIIFSFDNKEYKLVVPFLDDIYIDNVLLCLTTLLAMGERIELILPKLALLQPVRMRWTIAELSYNSKLIYDIQHNDLYTLSQAITKLEQQVRHEQFTVILSDLDIPHYEQHVDLYQLIINKLSAFKYIRLMLVGEIIAEQFKSFQKKGVVNITTYKSTATLLNDLQAILFLNEAVLILGGKHFNFNKLVTHFVDASHSAQLEVNLTTLKNNVAHYKSFLRKGVKKMGMVKAFGYGSGASEVAQLLVHQAFDYLGVAYIDEGVELRKSNIQIPIMIMNAEAKDFATLIRFQLEPVLYDEWILNHFLAYLSKNKIKNYPIHIEIDTGMHRLGFLPNQLEMLLDKLSSTDAVKVQSFFSHFCSSEAKHSTITSDQASLFQEVADIAKSSLDYDVLFHISNSAAVKNFPAYQMDMVRLGVGIYGFDAVEKDSPVKPIVSLKTSIAQIKFICEGDYIGYGATIVNKPTKTATIRIGYADGFSRVLGNGKGSVYIKNQQAQVIGNVCMDMIMVDITSIEDVQIGDEVEIFGDNLSFIDFCDSLEKSPYEVLSTIPLRVKRIYTEE